MQELQLKILRHNSPDYHAEVALRQAILRQPLGLFFSAEQLQAEADSVHIGAYHDEKLVACMVLKPLDDGEMQMRQVAVDAAAQGQGIGRMMVRYAEAFAIERGFQEMVLHARETAVVFYESLGYTRLGERFIEVTLPHWAMVKAL